MSTYRKYTCGRTFAEQIGYDGAYPNVDAALDAILASLGSGTVFPTVPTFADLPGTATPGDIILVETDTGLLFTRRQAGLYRWNGTDWVYSGDNTYTAIEISYDNTTSGLTAIETQGAIDEVLAATVANAAQIAINVTALNNHITDTTNPHSVTAAQVGADPAGTAATAAAANTALITTHTSDATIHFTEGSIDHANIQNVGTNTHAQIDAHIADTANPHSLDIDSLVDSPVPTPATANALYQLRVDPTGTDLIWWRDFYQVDERTDGLINQQNAVFEPYLTVNYDIPVAGDYLLDFSYIFSINNTTLNFEAHIEVNGTDVYPLHIESKDAGGVGVVLPTIVGGVEGPGTVNSGTDQFLNNSGKMVLTLPAGANTILLEFSARGAANLEAAMHRALFLLKRIP